MPDPDGGGSAATGLAAHPPTRQAWLARGVRPAAPARGRALGGQPTILRAGAVAIALGLVLILVSEAFHGGHQPADLRATLPVYAANDLWELVHLGQFLGYLLLVGGLGALRDDLGGEASAPTARLAFAAAVAGVTIYGVNQAVDGVAIQYVAEQWVAAPAAERDAAFRLADAVRHVEIGLTGLTQLTLGISLALHGLALAREPAYPRRLAWTAIALGPLFATVGVLVAHRGFEFVGLTQVAGLLLTAWFLGLAVSLWRRAGK